MSLTFGFYDSVDGDRKYNAQQMSAIFDGIINDGVFDSVGEHFAVSPTSGMGIKVGTGRAWFDHTWTYNDTDYPLTVSSSEVVLTRIDAVVLEVNNDSGTRANTIKMVEGIAGASPKRPPLKNTDTRHQHALAYITIPAGTTTITSSMIEMAVGSSETPFVTGILETTSIESLWSTWNGQFEDWFDHVKGQLSSDAAGNLQNQIDACVKTANKATLAEARAGTNDSKWMTPAKTAALVSPLNQAEIGDIYHSARNVEEETNGAFIALDGRVIDRENTYPRLANIYDLHHRIAPPTVIETSSTEWSSSSKGGVFLNGLYFWIARYTSDYRSSSYNYQLCVRKTTGAVEVLVNDNVEYVAVCGNHAIAVTDYDSTVRAYVYDNKGQLVRDIQLNSSKSLYVRGIYVSGTRCFILCENCGYYSDNNFATFGSTLFDGAATFTPSVSYSSDYGAYLEDSLKKYAGNLYFMAQTYRTEDGCTIYTLNLWKSTDGGGSFTKMWSTEYRSDDADFGYPDNPAKSFFYNGYIYMMGEYLTKESSSKTTEHECILKLRLSNGECVAKSEDISTSYVEFHGFIKDGYYYGYHSGYSGEYKMNLDNLKMEKWYPIHDYKTGIDFRNAIDIVTSDGKYWIAYGPYFSGPCDTDYDYGGIVVHDISTGKGVYLTEGLTMFKSSLSIQQLGGAFEDDDGNIIIPQGRYSGSTFYDSQLDKLDFSKIKLPSVEFAYLKAKELST